MCLFNVFYHVNLELLVYLDFQGIMVLLLSVLLINIHTLFFILLNVSFIVSFVSELNFMFHLALLIVILLSIFWYSWIVYFLCKFRFWIFCNFLLSKVFFILYHS